MGVIRSITKRIYCDKAGVAETLAPCHAVRHRGNMDYATDLLMLSLRMPQKSYRVRYSLNPKGRYRACLSGLETYEGAFIGSVCFLPQEWRGKRLSRTILPWTGGNYGIRG